MLSLSVSIRDFDICGVAFTNKSVLFTTSFCDQVVRSLVSKRLSRKISPSTGGDFSRKEPG